MMYSWIEGLHYICCMICMVCVGEWTFHWTVKNKKRFLIAGIIYVAGFMCLQLQNDSHIPFFMLFYIGEIVAWAIICKGNLRNRLLKILAIFYGVGVVEAGYMLLLELLTYGKLDEEVISLVAILLSMGSLAIVTHQKWYRKLIEYLQILSNRGAILLLLVVIGGLTMVGYGNMVQDIVQSDGLILLYRIIFVAELTMVIGIVVWLVQESNQKKYYLEQNAMKEEMLRTQEEYYKTVYEKDKEMRSFRHDVASQLGVLQILLKKGELEDARIQLKNIYDEFEKASFRKINIGDEMLDAILSMMNQTAEEKNIRLVVEGKIENEKRFNVYELCTIFSNAIKNALEACERQGNDGPVSVKVLDKKETLVCFVENPGTEEMINKILQNETSKQDSINHGYGVGNIQRAVKHLNGEMEYHYRDGKIILEIMI